MIYSTSNIEAIAGGDLSFVKSIVAIFIETSTNCLSEINKGIASENGALIKFNAHQLKPSIDLFEIEEGKQLVRDLELESTVEFVDFKTLALKALSFTKIIESVNKALKEDFLI